MRTTLNIDDELLAEAQRITGDPFVVGELACVDQWATLSKKIGTG